MPVIARLGPERRNEVRALIDELEAADGAPPLSENKLMRLEGRLDAREHIAVDDDDRVIGYGQAAWHRGDEAEEGHWALEVAVAPGWRAGNTTADLIECLRSDTGGADGMLWAGVDYVRDAATTTGWSVRRTLWQMRRQLPVPGLEGATSEARLATFRMGADEDMWLLANNAAFAGHPENGRMTRRDLERRMAQPWFDPLGFFVAWDQERIVGSCWTKVHESGLGEIYIIGVVPDWEGRGLGRNLLGRGLDHLHRDRHVQAAMLYVESNNTRATRLYEGLDFSVTRTLHALGYAAKALPSEK